LPISPQCKRIGLEMLTLRDEGHALVEAYFARDRPLLGERVEHLQKHSAALAREKIITADELDRLNTFCLRAKESLAAVVPPGTRVALMPLADLIDATNTLILEKVVACECEKRG